MSHTPDPTSAEAGRPFPLVAIYADESCLGNGREGSNPGGAGGVIEYVHPKSLTLTRWDYWVAEPATTNNRMALRSVIEAFRGISRKDRRFRTVFTSDSQYIVKGMREWLYSWIRRAWTKKDGQIRNLELWKAVVDSVNGHQVDPRWVHGHEGHPQNEYANYLAIRAAQEQTSSKGIVASTFDEWLAAEREHGRMAMKPQAFPRSEEFRAIRPYPVVAQSTPIT